MCPSIFQLCSILCPNSPYLIYIDINYTAAVYYVSDPLCDVSLTQEKTTGAQWSKNETVLSYIPACTESIDEIIASLPDSRWRLEIECRNKADVTARKCSLSSDAPPFNLSWAKKSPCLTEFVDHFCYEVKGQRVPHLVHYVWFGRNYFRPEHLISILSAMRYIVSSNPSYDQLFFTDFKKTYKNIILVLEMF